MEHIINDVKALDFTGERYIPEVRGDIELEHLHRYLLARQMVVGKTVLDIASGEGYGSAMLAQSACKVIGVDISKEAVSHAQVKYQAQNIEFLVGSCSAIPLDDVSVDVVVSFETIEHHDDHEVMIREIKRVLRRDGVLIISSPDKMEYSDKRSYSNPYHVKELYYDEFKKLLASSFKNSKIYGQRLIYGSAIFCENGTGPVRSHELADHTLSAIPGVPHPVYLVAVASDVELPSLDGGILEQSINETDLVREGASHIASLNQILTKQNEQIDSLNQAVAERDNQIAQIKSSRSWNITSPLRESRRWLTDLFRKVKGTQGQ